jgi:DNA-binding NarL/FixJ family response regulator
MQTLIDSIYDRLRAIGVSVETADATALMLVDLSPRKREAFYLWGQGMNNCEVAKQIGCNEITIRRILKEVCRKL